ncbi:MAG: vitamin K epoxide reductase family protein [Gemmatimonadetes bacterium]|nr:vitamin K epoxide reductase family protein [Gemmatimonadota bacterium]
MRHRQAIAVLSLAGFFVALYLWLYKIGVIGTVQCGTGGCETVQTSPYAVLFGIPVAFYGVVGYAVMFAVGAIGVQPRFLARRGPTLILAWLAGGAFLFALYLTYLELFVIHAICRWCVVSAVITTAIAAIAVPDALQKQA